MSAQQTIVMSAAQLQAALRQSRTAPAEGPESRRLRRSLADLEPCTRQRIELLAVLADSLEDDGCLAAASRARATATEEERQRTVIHAGADALKPAQRQALRRWAGVGRSTCPIDIVPGDAEPTRQGTEAHSTFKNGGRCQYPGAAIKAGYKVVYHPSTLEVVVGAGWLLRNLTKGD
jgi:hypothetical protein